MTILIIVVVGLMIFALAAFASEMKEGNKMDSCEVRSIVKDELAFNAYTRRGTAWDSMRNERELAYLYNCVESRILRKVDDHLRGCGQPRYRDIDDLHCENMTLKDKVATLTSKLERLEKYLKIEEKEIEEKKPKYELVKVTKYVKAKS